jgi:hypothetical protein
MDGGESAEKQLSLLIGGDGQNGIGPNMGFAGSPAFVCCALRAPGIQGQRKKPLNSFWDLAPDSHISPEDFGLGFLPSPAKMRSDHD